MGRQERLLGENLATTCFGSDVLSNKAGFFSLSDLKKHEAESMEACSTVRTYRHIDPYQVTDTEARGSGIFNASCTLHG